MTKTSTGASIEQSCIRPGTWRVEGYLVERVREDFQSVTWHITDPTTDRTLAVAVSLGDARDWIRAQITNR